MTKILVIGGSSGVGAEVVKLAAASGHFVRAMSRRGVLPDSVEGDCEGFAGNALNEEDVTGALAGVDVVVQALGIPASIGMVLEPVTLFSAATRVLVPRMEKAGVQRLISVTGFGAGDSNDSINCFQRVPFELVFRNAYDDKSVQEQLIVDSDLDWVLVRPGALTNGDRTNRYSVLLEKDAWRNGIISRADVADFIVSQIGADGYSKRKPVLIRYPL